MVKRSAGGPVVALLLGFGDYQVQVTSGIDLALRERGVPLMGVCVDSFASTATSGLVLDFLRHGEARGVIILSDVAAAIRPDLRAALAESGTPVATIGVKYPESPCVSGENEPGMRALLAHLLDERGVRRPVLVRGSEDHPDSLLREELIRQECARRGIALDEDLVIDGRFMMKPTSDAMHQLLQRRRDFDAVIAFNDTSAMGAMAALRGHGFRLPEDVAVSGFDNLGIGAETWPPLTTVDQRLGDQGGIAVDLLFRLIAGERDVEDVVAGSRLIRRASTGVGELTVDQLLPISEAALTRTNLHENVLQVSIDMANCSCVEDLAAVLRSSLPEAKIARCFLALDPSEMAGSFGHAGPGEHQAALAFAYQDGRSEPPPEDAFPRHRLLPPSLRAELGTGNLVLQALSVEGRERGHLVYEMPDGYSPLAEMIRLELPRVVDTILSSQELHRYASALERMVAERTRELETANEALQRSVMLDGLTGVANRKAFDQSLEKGFRVGDGEHRRTALLMIDVDMFKAYNDHYGHLGGDAALKVVASCLDGVSRSASDLTCRYGGEEFAVILWDCDLRVAVRVARRFLRRLDRAAVPHEYSPVAPFVTASVGVAAAVITSGDDPRDLVKAADDALYKAKLQGRNRLVVAPDVARRRADAPSPPGSAEAACGTAIVGGRAPASSIAPKK